MHTSSSETSLKETLADVINRWNLLQNPFYAAWSAGTLPLDALQMYASEYAHFLELLPLGWQTLHDSETAAEESEHAEIWQEFARSLHADVIPTPTSAQLPETQRLVALAQEFFAKPATAAGALYAFEVQQPATASSKLVGLRTHYAQLHADEKYFETHSHNEHEAEKLFRVMSGFSPAERTEAVTACQKMSQALWETLAAIHNKKCATTN